MEKSTNNNKSLFINGLHLVAIICFISNYYCWTVAAAAVDMDGVKEGACIRPPLLDKSDLKWMFTSGIQEWYTPLGSKYQIYKTASEFLQKPMEEITDAELDSACLVITDKKTTGFDGKYLIPDNKFGQDGIMELKYKDRDASATNYMTLTDKKSYVVIIGYWNDTAQKSWVVASTSKTLSDKAKKKIIKHISSFGFDPTKAHEINYDLCTNTDKDDKDKTEL